MTSDRVDLLTAVSKLSVAAVALIVLAGALWLQMQERRFEADRADRDREMVTNMLRESIDSARKDREAMQLRGNRFVKNQEAFLKHQAALVMAVELQRAILEELKEEQIKGTKTMEETLKRETQVLIDAVIEANKK